MNEYFKRIRILDGGMGQELLNRGVEQNGTLWSSNALLNEKYHKLILDSHIDFIKAGAEVIVTVTFTSRRMRLRENNIEYKFEYLNKKAGEIAQKAKKQYPHIMIAGSLPPQYLTYEQDIRDDIEIKQNFYDQAKILNEYIDFFYFDVLSSIREIKLAIDAIKDFDKPYLIGIHISDGNKLPSGEKISDISPFIKNKNLLGIILSCVSPETYLNNSNELKNLGIPFGFKLNAFITTNPNNGYTNNYKKYKGINPNEFLGKRKDLSPEKLSNIIKKFKDDGATILGGCCETTPDHIKEISKLKNDLI